MRRDPWMDRALVAAAMAVTTWGLAMPAVAAAPLPVTVPGTAAHTLAAFCLTDGLPGRPGPLDAGAGARQSGLAAHQAVMRAVP